MDYNNINKLYANAENVFMITNDKELYIGGDNTFGKLGLGYAENSYVDKLKKLNIDVTNIKALSQGNYFSFMLTNDNEVYAWGHNFNGNLGTGIAEHTYSPIKMNISDAKQIACSNYFNTFIIKNDGTLWHSGINSYGEAGYSGRKYTFTQVTTNINNDVKQVFCGDYHTFMLKNDNTVWATGRNNAGQLGLGDNANRKAFTHVSSMSDVKQIACGGSHTFVLKNDGTVWACGDNTYGQLGLGDNANRNTFTHVSSMSDVKQISCGSNYTFIIKNDGTLWACGHNQVGQLGLGDNTNRNTFTHVSSMSDIKKLSCGALYSFIIKNNGTVWATGNNSYSQLNLGDKNNRNIFTQTTININNDIEEIYCGYYQTIMLKNDKTLYGCGFAYYGQLGVTYYYKKYGMANTGLTNVKKVYLGSEHCFVLNNNELYVCGLNGGSNLGNGLDYEDVVTLTKIMDDVADVYLADYTTFVKKLDGSIYYCGANWYGGLGIDNDYEDVGIFTKHETLTNMNIKKMIVDECSTMVLTNNDELYSTGYNDEGQLGLGDNTGRTVFTKVNISDIKDVVYIFYNFFVLKNDNTLWACGENSTGGLGTGDTNNRNTFTKVLEDVKQIPCGIPGQYIEHTFAIKNDNTLWACGVNSNGQLGTGDTNNRNTFTKVFENVKNVYINENHTFVLTNDNEVYACGANNYGQLGINSDELKVLSFTKVNLNFKVKDIVLGKFTTFIISQDNRIHFCGLNNFGQTGCHIAQFNAEGMFKQITEYIDPEHFNNVNVPINGEMKFVEKMSSGYSHDLAICEDGIYITGSNNYGQLGLGDYENRHFYTKINIDNIIDASCGDAHTILLNDSGEMYVTGLNTEGQLGLENYNSINSFTKLDANNIKHARAIKTLTVVEKDGEYYVTGADKWNGLTKYNL